MPSRLAFSLCAAFALASLAAPAAAFPLCEEGKPDAADDDDDLAATALRDDRLVLPCALADTQTGCADAAVYVVTNAGVLLCQIDTLFLASASGGEQIDDAPCAPAAVSASAFFAAAVPVKTIGLPPVIVQDVVAGFAPVRGAVRDGFADFSTPPS